MSQDLGNTIKGLLVPSEDQKRTIYFIIGFFVGIAIIWAIPFVNYILLPFKIVTVALHEFGHAIAGVCTGAKIEGIEVEPNEGGVTRMRGGNPYCTLPAGYISSAIWGAAMIFCGFNLTATKVISCILGVAMFLTLWWARSWLTRFITILPAIPVVLLWYFKEDYLRYFVLFMGVMSAMYALWDIIDDLIRRKVNESDASQFARLCCGGPRLWGVIWFFISFVFIAIAVIAGLMVFKSDGVDSNNAGSASLASTASLVESAYYKGVRISGPGRF
ncbi:peptidase M50B-like-domain-containing protein [Cladochytrium replicatum]|nr:peptidase M50B-like-domain-containing protein [Cladochytrium replicatum]